MPLTAGGDDDGNDEAVDAQHTRHDDLVEGVGRKG